jgi:hypothetical protein
MMSDSTEPSLMFASSVQAASDNAVTESSYVSLDARTMS